MKLAFFCLLFSFAVSARASVVITLDQSMMTGQPGQTITFSGTLENTSGVEQYISLMNLTTDPSLIGNATPFIINGFSVLTTSFSLLPGAPTLSFGLFDIEIPLFTIAGTYSVGNEFSLAGGPNFGDLDPFTSVLFSVTVEDPNAIPEPGTWGLGLLGLGLLWRKTR